MTPKRLSLFLISLLTLTTALPSQDTTLHLQDHATLTGPILSKLGFHGLSAAASALANATVASSIWRGPVTVFAPTDSSLATCPSCSLPLVLREHTLPGLFPLGYLRTLPFGTKIESLSPNHCLTITKMNVQNDSKNSGGDVYVSGVKITRPDLYTDGHVTVHGLQGYVAPLSPYSCDAHRMNSISVPNNFPRTMPFYFTKLMLKDAMHRLGISGYAIVALALRVKYADLVTLNSMTIFALDDATIFSGSGHDYVSHFRAHVIPNKMLTAADIAALPVGTILPTMYNHRNLIVTSPMRINYVKMRTFDMMYNLRIVVHGLSVPFPNIDPNVVSEYSKIGVSEWADHRMVSPAPAIGSVVQSEHHHGL